MEPTFLGTHTASAWVRDWRLVNATVDRGGGVVLSREPSSTFVSPDALDLRVPTGHRVVDVDVGDCGGLFVLFKRIEGSGLGDALADEAGVVHRYDVESGRSEVLVCVPDARLAPTSLCVTRDTIYVASRPRLDAVGSEEEEGSEISVGGQVRAFARYGGETRWVKGTARVDSSDAEGDTGPSDQVRFARPVALACGSDNIYAVDKGAPGSEDGSSGFLVRIDVDGTAVVVDDGLTEPRDVAVVDESILVLETDEGSVILAYTVEDGAISGSPNRTAVSGTDSSFTLSCLDAVARREVVAGVGPGVSGETTLFRFRLNDESMTRVATYRRSARRLAIAPGRDHTNDDREFMDEDDDDGSVDGEDDADDGVTGCDHGDGSEQSEGPEGYETGGRLYVIDGTDRSVSVLSEMRPNATNTVSGRADAQMVRRFDSAARGTQWHRVRLETDRTGDVGVAGATQIRARYYATDDDDRSHYDLQTLAGIGAMRVEALEAAGIEDLWGLLDPTPDTLADQFPNVSVEMARDWQSAAWQVIEDRWSGVGRAIDHPDPKDALFESATGRYLWIRIELDGSEYASPRLSTFRAYFPRQSYLRYLPDVYRADAESADFLERYLSLFESTFADLGEDIESITRYLDPCAVPESSLSWLGGWLGFDLDEEWPEAARRDLLTMAPDLFTMRGTRRGLLATLGVYLKYVDLPTLSWDAARNRERARLADLRARGDLTEEEYSAALDRHAALAEERESPDHRPLILEYSDLDCVDTDAVRAVYTRLVSCPQCFLVLLPAALGADAARVARRIVNRERPAHSVGRAVHLRRDVQLGANTYLGVNTTLPDRDLIVDRSSLGTDSVLGMHETHGRLDVASHVGRDTTLS